MLKCVTVYTLEIDGKERKSNNISEESISNWNRKIRDLDIKTTFSVFGRMKYM